MFKKTCKCLGIAALALAFAPWGMAQEAPEPTVWERLKFRRKALDKFAGVADMPTAGSKTAVAKKDDGSVPPTPGTTPPPPPPEPPIEDAPEEEPPVEDEEPPTFFGEPVSGNFVLVLDRSGSMGAQDSGSGPIEDANGGIISNPSRIVIVKAEATKVLQQLSEDDEFAICSFGANPAQKAYESRVPANAGNVAQGISEINALVASGATPAYSALRNGCTKYNAEPGLDKYYFLCDGSPNSDAGAPGGNGNASVILADFPAWWQGGPGANDCTMVCVHIGTSGAAGQFMQALANLCGGVYTHH
jgi:hypothetical protein